MPFEKYKPFLSLFPLTVIAAVEAEHIRADRTFVAARKGARTATQLVDLVNAYVMRVFLAFASALCKLGSKGQFDIRDIDSKCRQFLRLVAQEAYQERIWTKTGALGRKFLLSSENFAETIEALQKTHEWNQYQIEHSAVQNKLLADLDRQANSESSAEPGARVTTDSPTFNWTEWLTELPELTEDYIQTIKREAQKEIACARSQLDFMAKAQGRLDLLKSGKSKRRLALEADRDHRLENAEVHVQLAAGLLFDAYADQYWQAIRPNAQKLSELLPMICSEVENALACPELFTTIRDTLRERTDSWTDRTGREETVVDSTLWADLQAKFASLAQQEATLFQNVTDVHLLHAHGDYTVGIETGYWRLSGSSENLRADFEVLATQAGIELKPLRGANPVCFWLHCLFLDPLENQSSRYLFAAQKGKGGTIRLVLESSATYCARLERVALENEYRQNAMLETVAPMPKAKNLSQRKMPLCAEDAVVLFTPGRQPPSDETVVEQTANFRRKNSNDATQVAEERTTSLTAYKARGRELGIRITDAMVANAAHAKWNDRTMVSWWKRNDARCKLAHDKKIRAVLSKDPTSIWSPETELKKKQ